MKNPVRTGTIIALAAGSLFAVACSKSPESKSTMPAAGGEKTAAGVHCLGINSCKGQNSCKGEGMMDTASADECTTKGGTVGGN